MPLAASWPWEWSASAWSALTFLVFLAAALFARRQAIEARRLREQQARPFVLIEFRAVQTIIEIAVTNIGTTIARDVQFEFDPPLVSAYDSEPGQARVVSELSMFKEGIPSLAPQREMRVFFDQFPRRAEAKLPMTYHVAVSFSDLAGQRHTEQQVLDLSVWVGTGGVRRDGLHEIHQQLKTIAEQVKRWTDSGGLHVVTTADIEARNAAWKKEYEERQRAAQEAAAEPDSASGSPAD